MGQSPTKDSSSTSKHRVVTYLTPDHESAQKAKGIKWLEHEISGPRIDAARQERIGVPSSVLGQSVRSLLEGCSKLHFRWVQPNTYDTLDPLSARASPGLHVSFTARGDGGIGGRHVCQMVNELFDIEACEGPESFIVIPAESLGAKHASPNQFYHPLQRMADVDATLMEALCGSSKVDDSCKPFFESLSSAASFDMSWDLDEPTLHISAMWPLESRHIEERPFEDFISQVAVLYHPDVPSPPPYQVPLEGHTYNFQSGSQPEKRNFAPAARHRKHPGTISVELIKPAGLHPTLQLNMETRKPPAGLDHCRMHAYLTLPRNIFADRYQLQDALFLESKNLAAFSFSSDPVDLEAPEYTVRNWGSTIMVELAPKPDFHSDNAWKAQIPLHLRYMAPEAGGYARFDLPYPAVFWSCEVPALEHDAKVDTSDHDKMLSKAWGVTNVGYDALFPDNTAFWHLQPVPRGGVGLYNTVVVPVANSDQTAWVGVGTALAVVLGTSWVMWTLFAAWFASFNNEASAVAGKRHGSVETSGKKTSPGGGSSGVDIVDDEEEGGRGEMAQNDGRPVVTNRRSKRTAAGARVDG